ncbi:hypothetical protein IHE44_0001298 [Lamprotornis superbus]|uniref:G-protein coupled receptor 20 n=1 Tax=Lamprotornis superbus TaxID=245042 RepID=A0A835NRK8_9PASS|nr:hypothetical protein IHE44_0001298 [Lamprotornis superbus]
MLNQGPRKELHMKHLSQHILPEAEQAEWRRLLNTAINPTRRTYNTTTALLPPKWIMPVCGSKYQIFRVAGVLPPGPADESQLDPISRGLLWVEGTEGKMITQTGLMKTFQSHLLPKHNKLLAKGQSKRAAEGRKKRKCSKNDKFAIKNFFLKSKQQYTGQTLFLHLPVKLCMCLYDCWKSVTMPTSSTLDSTNSTEQPNSNMNLFSKFIHSDEQLYRDFYSLWIVLMVVNAIIFLVGVVLNSLALYVFCFRTKTKTTSVIYTINLIVTDLLVGFFLPVRIIMFYSAGDCKNCSLVHIFGYFVNMYCSILFLTCICVDRYLAIVQVEASRKWRNPTCAKGICIFIWIFATVVTFSILTMAIKFAECCLSKILVLMVCEYFFPLIIIIFFTTRIMCALSKPSLMHQSRERRMRAVQLLITVLIIFMICFTPFHVLQVAISINPDMPHNVSLLVYHVTVTLSSLNSCMDPIVYCFVTNNFQSTMKNIFRKTEPEQTNADILGMNKNSKGSNAIIAFSNTIGSPLSLPSPSTCPFSNENSHTQQNGDVSKDNTSIRAVVALGKDLGETRSDLHSCSGTEEDEEDIAKEPKPKSNKEGREGEGPNRLNKLSSMKGRASKNKDKEGRTRESRQGTQGYDTLQRMT